jgi:glyoxylase-like metal-dependent hydrolase (beta-lactamase superfamily II)
MPLQKIFFLIYALICFTASAQGLSDKDVQITELADNIHVLMAVGGNIAVSSGSDGLFIIDDSMPPLAEKIEAALRTIRDEPVRMVFNTHWHFDHTGGNRHFGEQGALIVAHDNVRERMSTKQFSFNMKSLPSPKTALPVVTFDQGISFHLNGDTIRALHIANGHTDGDAVLFFEGANIVHTGDLFTNRQYPFIDLSGGGSAQGMLAAVDTLIPMLNEDTIIIPGHGPIATLEDVQTYRSMLYTVINRIQLLIDEGKTADEVIALRPSVNFDATWAWSFLPAERWNRLIYDSLIADTPVKEAD